MSTICFAILQTQVFEDKRANLRQAEELLGRVSLQNIDFAILPEMFCCPYQTERFPVYAEEEGGESFRACSAMAEKYGIYLAAGSMPERDWQGHVYNTAYVFDRQGRRIAKHRKLHLFDIDVEGGQSFRESDTLSAGNEITVFDTEFCRMGICICYDLRFPELFRLMELDGAEVVLVPAAFNMTTGPAHWELLFRQRAVDNQAWFIGAASARDCQGSYVSWGHSIVTDPWGSVVAQMDEKPGVRVVEIDLDMGKRVRRELPFLSQRRTDLYRLEKTSSTGEEHAKGGQNSYDR